MTITLSPETQNRIEERMKATGLLTPDDVVRAALEALDQQDALSRIDDAAMEALNPGFREKIAQGLAEANVGKVTDGEAFFDELEREEQEFESGQGRKTA